MAPKSTTLTQSVTRNLRELKLPGLYCLVMLLFGVTTALALTHITIASQMPAAVVAQPYSATVSITGGSGPFHFLIDQGALPPGLTLAGTTGVISGTPTSAGTYRFHVDVTGSGGSSHGDSWVSLKTGNHISVKVSPATPSILSGGSQQFTAYVTGTSNTAVTWSASAGTISNSGSFSAPTVSRAMSATVTAISQANPSIKGTAAVTIATSSALAITTTSLPGGTTGTTYGAALYASGGSAPYTWSISAGSLPSGISLDSTTGALSGTPTAQGTYSFSAQVKDTASATDTQSLSIVVSTSSGKYDGPAELPRVYVQTTMANTPAPGKTITVLAGDNLQTALNAAKCGDTVTLQAGATFTGKFTLPANSCDNGHWIIVRTSAPDTSLPPEGTRMTPCYAGVASLPARPSFGCSTTSKVLAQLSYPGGGAQSGPLALAVGANYYRLVGLEITRPVGTGSVSNLVSGGQTASADHIILDRCWIHGTAHDETRTGVSVRGISYAAVIDSYINDLHCTSGTGACTDAVAIGGGNGTVAMGPFKITNNFLESSGENILFGGAAATTTPADIEIRRNHFFKPLVWMKGSAGYVGGVSGNPFIVKNHLEFKNAQRVLIEGNIFENCWGGFSQSGASILMTPRNQFNKKLNQSVCPVCTVTDITIRYNTISHVGSGIHMGTGTDHGGYSLWGARYSIHDVVIDDVNGARYIGGGALLKITNNRPAYILNNVTINHITGLTDPTSSSLVIGDPATQPKMWGLLYTNNLVVAGRYPLWNAFAGADCATIHVPTTALPACFSSYGFSHNALIATPAAFGPSTWPAGNFFPTAATSVQFVNYNGGIGGDYHLSSSSPYAHAASDGKDLGADVDAVKTATAGVN